MRIPSLAAPLLASVSLARLLERPGSPRKSSTTTRRAKRCCSRSAQAHPDRRTAQAVALAGPAEAASGTEGAADPADPHAARGGGQWRGARAAHTRGLHQRHAGLSLLGWRALSGLRRARPDHRHRAGARRAAGRLRPGRRRRHRALGDRRHRERHGASQARPHPRQADARGPRHQSCHQHRPADLPSSSFVPPRRPTWRRSRGPMRRTSSSPCAGRMPRQKQALPWRSGVDINALNFRYKIEGDTPPWRPLRAFDDGRQVFIAFPTGDRPGRDAAAVGDRLRRRRRARQLPHSGQSHDRRPAVCGSRAAAGRRDAEEGPHRPYRWKAAVMTDVPSDAGCRDADAMRRGCRCGFGRAGPPVTRLSRKVIVALGSPAGARDRGCTVLLRCSPGQTDRERRTLWHRQPHDAGWPFQPAPRLCGPAKRRSSARPAASRRSRPPDPQCGRCKPSRCPTAPDAEKQTDGSGAGGRTGQSSVRHNQRLEQNTSRHTDVGKCRRPAGRSGTAARSRLPRIASSRFLNGNVDRRTVSAERIERPASPYVLQAGAVIPAALLTGLRSDLPGQVTAQVTEGCLRQSHRQDLV